MDLRISNTVLRPSGFVDPEVPVSLCINCLFATFYREGLPAGAGTHITALPQEGGIVDTGFAPDLALVVFLPPMFDGNGIPMKRPPQDQADCVAVMLN